MLTGVNLICCIIVLSGTSVSAYIYTENAQHYHQWSVEVKSCASAGAQNGVYTVNLSEKSIGAVSYDSFNEYTTIIAIGEFNLTTGSSTLHLIQRLLLDDYIDSGEQKTYKGVLHVETGMGWSTQKNHLEISVTKEKSGPLNLKCWFMHSPGMRLAVPGQRQ